MRGRTEEGLGKEMKKREMEEDGVWDLWVGGER